MAYSPHRLAFAALLVALTWTGHATAADDPAIAVEAPFARATASTARTGAAYMTLVNRGTETDRLVGASTPNADKVELHMVEREGDVMRMRQVAAIDLPAGQRVALAPGGYHVMLLGLKGPLKQGETVPLTLTFARAGAVEVQVPIGAAGASGTHEHKH